MSERNDIDELFRSSFEGFEVPPPASVKEAVDKAIDQRGKRRLLFWIWLPVLLIGCITGLLLPDRQEREQLPVSENTADRSLQGVRRAPELTYTSQPVISTSDETRLALPLAAIHPEQAIGADRPSITDSSPKKLRAVTSRKFNPKNAIPAESELPDETGLQPVSENPVNTGLSNDPVTASADQSGNAPAPDSTSAQAADSTATANQADSVEQSQPGSTQTSPVMPPENLKRWELSLYGGPSFGWNTGERLEIKERGSLLLSLEIGRYFGDVAIHSGLGYGQRRDELKMEYTVTETVFAGYDSIPVFDPDNPDSILYYDTIGIYEPVDKPAYERSNYSVSSFSLPIGVSWRRRFGASPFGIFASGQVQLHFQQAKELSWTGSGPDTSGSETPPTTIHVNRFGVSANLRAQLTYDWNRFRFSAGFAGGMDFRPAVIPDGYTRKRYYFMPQLGVHFAF